MHNCHISRESGWNYINIFSVCIKAKVTAWIRYAFVPAAVWILVLILSLAGQEGQNLETNAGFYLSVFKAPSKRTTCKCAVGVQFCSLLSPVSPLSHDKQMLWRVWMQWHTAVHKLPELLQALNRCLCDSGVYKDLKIVLLGHTTGLLPSSHRFCL